MTNALVDDVFDGMMTLTKPGTGMRSYPSSALPR